jgi:hypothetical protein
MVKKVEFILESRQTITFLKSDKSTGEAVSKFLEKDGLLKHS